MIDRLTSFKNVLKTQAVFKVIILLIIVILNITVINGSAFANDDSVSASSSSSDHNIALMASLGAPDLLSFQVQFLRLKWVQFGFGFGIQPVNSIAKNYVDIAPLNVDIVGSSYSVKPTIDLGLKTSTSFIKIFPIGEKFYLDLKYSTWNIAANADLNARNLSTGSSLNMGSIGISAILPMAGVNIGFQTISKSGFMLDFGIGGLYYFNPSVNVSLGGMVGSAASLSQLDPAMNKQVNDAINSISNSIKNSVKSLRDTLPLIPVLYVSAGWAF
jgi:hypothetical protein